VIWQKDLFLGESGKTGDRPRHAGGRGFDSRWAATSRDECGAECAERMFSAGRQADGDGEGKRRTGEDATVSREWARVKLVHTVQSESRPQAQPSSETGPKNDGRVLDGPAVHPQPCLDVRARNGQIEVGRGAEPASRFGRFFDVVHLTSEIVQARSRVRLRSSSQRVSANACLACTVTAPSMPDPLRTSIKSAIRKSRRRRPMLSDIQGYWEVEYFHRWW
jgi:hypothetical protein